MSVSLLSLLLMMPSQLIATVADLQAALKKVSRGPSSFEDDPNFVIDPIDWTKLTAPGNDEAFRWEMRQANLIEPYDCLLNAVRFAVQRKFDRMIGRARQGDRAVLSVVKGAYIHTNSFDSEVKTQGLEITLNTAKDYLKALGINAGSVDLTGDLKGHINFLRGHGASGVLFVAGEQDEGNHTYVLFEFRDVGPDLEAKIYNPWTGTLRSAPLTPDLDWCDVIDFQNNFAMPVDSVGNRLPMLDPTTGSPVRDSLGNQVYLRPGQPLHSSQQALYQVLFAPLN
jgi:hypothetical protein